MPDLKSGIWNLKFALAVLLLVGAAHAQTAETACAITPASSPALRGFHLGMKSDELFTLLKGSKPEVVSTNDQRQFGFAVAEFRPGPARGQEFVSAGIDLITIETLDDVVTAFAFQYKFQTGVTAKAAAAKLSETTGLPNSWLLFGHDSGELGGGIYLLNCRGFAARVTKDLNISIKFEDLSAAQTLRERKASKQGTFKP